MKGVSDTEETFHYRVARGRWLVSSILILIHLWNMIQSACSLVGFWADKSGWCWFVVRGKYYTMTDKSWLKPTNEQPKYRMMTLI